jgi:hypothetical protein
MRIGKERMDYTKNKNTRTLNGPIHSYKKSNDTQRNFILSIIKC